ncbi:MAG: polymerase [Actinomycetota bacterium]
MLINVLREEKPTHIAVAFDVSRKSFRTDRFPEYKATRSASPAEFKGQVELIEEVLKAFDIKSFRVEGFEADDIIATLTTEASAQGFSVDIVTGDRDAFQLVSDGVTVLYPRKGVSDLARMSPEAVEEKYGLSPEQYPDFAALRGDPSDNLPGIPGVGEKTAQKWLEKYGSLGNLIDHADEITGKVGEALRDAIPQVRINRDLTQLLHDVPLHAGVSSCDWRGYETQLVDQVFTALQFSALRSRLSALPSQGESDAPTGKSSIGSDLAIKQLRPEEISAGIYAIALDASADNAALTSDGLTVYLVSGYENVAKVLENSAIHKQLHDAKPVIRAALERKHGFTSLDFDTALAAYLLQPGQRSYALDAVALNYLGVEIESASAEQQLELISSEKEDHAALAHRAALVYQLQQIESPRIQNDDLGELLRDIEQPVAQVLAEMESVGIAVSADGLAELSSEFAGAMRSCESEAEKIVGRPFNMGSPKQLQEILFGERNLPKTKKIKTGYTTDAEALQNLYEQTEDPLLELILAWRDRSKLRQTVDGLIPLIASDGRVHTTFHQMVAATGRLSSSDPNLQNIPVRTEAGRRIRACFVVGDGFESLLTADYSQIELRIMAHVSQDAGLIEAFLSGEDLHTTVASQVFGVARSDVNAEMRRQIKAMSYGLAYGLSPFGLSQQLRISPAEAQQLMDVYFERFGGVRDYLADVVNEARTTGFTETMFGRRRYLPDLNHDNRQRREMAERMALNAPIQGTAADIVKIAMLNVAAGLENLESRLLLQVHDELVVEVAHGEVDQVEEIVRTGMGSAAELLVPLDVSVGVGPDWESAAH